MVTYVRVALSEDVPCGTEAAATQHGRRSSKSAGQTTPAVDGDGRWPAHSRWRLLLATLLLASVLPLAESSAATQSGTAQAAQLTELVNRLGSSEYQVRQRAQEELRQLGVAAFETLDVAQTHPDVEIRKQAEYLLRAIRIRWVDDDDPEEVKKLVHWYGEAEGDARFVRLAQLAQTEGPAALRTLCRLARFETSDLLSRRAALAVLNSRTMLREMPSPLFQSVVEESLGVSERPAAQWLRLLARERASGQFEPETWRQLVAAELAAVERRPDKERIATARELFKWQLLLAQERQQESNVRELAQQLLSLQAVDEDQLLNLVDWMIDSEVWPAVALTLEKHAALVADHPRLQYRQAQLWTHEGKQAAAESLVKELIESQTKPENTNEFVPVSHAIDLHLRGQFDWAERKFRRVLETTDPASYANLMSSFRLGVMLYEMGRYADAYEEMHRLTDRVLNDPEKKLTRRLQEIDIDPRTVISQAHLCHALMLAETHDVAGQQQALRSSLEYDSENADTAIAMFRLQGGDEKWAAETRQCIDKMRQLYEQKVTSTERDAEAIQDDGRAHRDLAQSLNQLAWLISNTDGDFDRAVRLSRRSLELAPEKPEYLDTLGRCYYAAHDLARATRCQRHAVELERHSRPIRRQLAQFESELAAQGQATKPHVPQGEP